MPYINRGARKLLSEVATGNVVPETAGQLSYLVTLLLDEYICHHGKDYAVLNQVIGVLECAKLELYRRILAPYEDKKCQENGDVYSGVS